MEIPIEKPSCTKPLPDHRADFRDVVCDWFDREGKDFPWRKTRDPYEVLVSEVMLQQTRIATVLERGYYTRFLDSFPTVRDLAVAADDELLKAWEGLGYYRRVRMLRSTAQAVVENHDGEFPRDLEELLQLPGIGRYTAGALRAFAFEVPAVLVDGNVIRVLARLLDERGELYSSAGSAKVWRHAEDLADGTRPRSYHSGLMELGQTYCRVGTPECGKCPVAEFCSTRNPEVVPRKKPRKKPQEITEHAIWFRDSAGRLLLHRESGDRRTGLWKLPLRSPDQWAKSPLLSRSVYAITRYKVHLIVLDGGVVASGHVEEDGDEWFAPAELEDLAMAAPFRRVVRKLIHDS